MKNRIMLTIIAAVVLMILVNSKVEVDKKTQNTPAKAVATSQEFQHNSAKKLNQIKHVKKISAQDFSNLSLSELAILEKEVFDQIETSRLISLANKGRLKQKDFTRLSSLLRKHNQVQTAIIEKELANL